MRGAACGGGARDEKRKARETELTELTESRLGWVKAESSGNEGRELKNDRSIEGAFVFVGASYGRGVFALCGRGVCDELVVHGRAESSGLGRGGERAGWLSVGGD